MRVEADDCQHLDRALSLEWLETNGRGGYASGTVVAANTRRYHALLLIARHPPVDRYVLVNHLEEWVAAEAHTFAFSTALYDGAVHPHGYRYCQSFDSQPWPTWRYQAGEITLQREIFCSWGRDLVVIRWRLLAGPHTGVTLKVRPMLTGRDYHATHHQNTVLTTEVRIAEQAVSWQPYRDVPAVQALHNGRYRHVPDWYRAVYLPAERERGLDDREDWWSPGEIVFQVVPGASADLVLTTELSSAIDVSGLEKEELARRAHLAKSAPKRKSLAASLWSAAPAFLSIRGEGHTVIAGYPWFTDWGRDTFLALPGLCLVTGWHEVAWQIIATFAEHLSEGMLPNRFPDAGTPPEYNAMDSSLWFAHAVDRYLFYTEDHARVRMRAWPAIKQILDWYRRGTRYGIRQDADGLLTGGAPGMQLTWMDVKIGDQVVTPRHGKPVEIQALWIRALAIGELLATRYGEQDYAVTCSLDRARASDSFRRRFWCEQAGYLYDVIDGPDGDDSTFRPNQLYAIALGEELVEKPRANRILDIVRAKLLTPVGVRTLSPDDPRYRARYEGDVPIRDSAYHQGTVWPFLLGAFITAWIKTKGRSPRVNKQARAFLDGLTQHLGEAGLGQVSEIFDGDPPHTPRGCTAQAWSVAEPLRALMEDL